jgi:hypothetical protein
MFVVKEMAGVRYRVANDDLRRQFKLDPSQMDKGAIVMAWSGNPRSADVLMTNDFRYVRQLAATDQEWFVVTEPALGWSNIDEPADGAPLPPTYADEVSPWTMLAVAAGLGLAAWLLWS